MTELLIFGIGIGSVGLTVLTVAGVYMHQFLEHKRELEKLSEHRGHAIDILRIINTQLDAVKDWHEDPEKTRKSIIKDNPGMKVDVHESLSWHLRVAQNSIQNVLGWLT